MEEYIKHVHNSMMYYTVSDYFMFLEKKFGIARPNENERKEMYKGTGLECSSICDDRNIIVEKVHHPEFHSINKYPEYILAEAIFGAAYVKYFPLYSPNLKIRYPSVPTRKLGK